MKKHLIILLSIISVLINFHVSAQEITTTKEHFGFQIGEDYHLANYTQIEAYFKKLADQSDRVLMRNIGITEEGRDQYILIVSSPENLENIERYKSISQRMARAEDLTESEAKDLAKEGKSIVWIDGGLHTTETVGSHQLVEFYFRLLTQNDPETIRILDEVIILLSHVNPDGQELLANWYMKEEDPLKRNMKIPRLYHKYIGHDNNRDFYMMNMKETTNISKQLYIEWMPQIVYNHHQFAPGGTVVAGPPYRDPFNYVYDPLLITGIDAVGSAMINRLNSEGKPGYTRLDGSPYNTWWNGGLRTTPYFHNMIGILTEVTGGPSPTKIPFVPERLVPNNDNPNPIRPQSWSFMKSIEYSISLNYAILDYASRFGDQLLMNIYKMGKNSIEKGNQDHWTLQSKISESARSKYETDTKEGLVKASERGKSISTDYYDTIFKDPELRDARGYIIPADQSDFPTAIKFINSLIKSGILVYKATADFNIKGKNYLSGSYVVKTNQAFRPHVIDMFEAQNHPHVLQYPGGPPKRPYDATGWTLAYQMGVEFDRILDEFSGPFERIDYGELQKAPIYNIVNSSSGYWLDVKENNTFIAVNELLKAGVKVYRTSKNQDDVEKGCFYVPAKGYKVLQQMGKQFGVHAQPANNRPKSIIRVKPSRIALYDRYGGSMSSGWTRWILEQFHFSFQLIYPQDIDKGNLNKDYDVILFINEGMPTVGKKSTEVNLPKEEEMPEEFQKMLGKLTADKSIPKLKEFIEKGGDIVTVGSSTSLCYHFDLPIESALTKEVNGENKKLASSEYFIPGSILSLKVDTLQPINWGLKEELNVMFKNSPVFKLSSNSIAQDIQPIASFDNDQDLLRSGWALGEDYLKGGIAAFSASVGKGNLYVFGPDIVFRAQSHSTFKMLFNTLYYTER